MRLRNGNEYSKMHVGSGENSDGVDETNLMPQNFTEENPEGSALKNGIDQYEENGIDSSLLRQGINSSHNQSPPSFSDPAKANEQEEELFDELMGERVMNFEELKASLTYEGLVDYIRTEINRNGNGLQHFTSYEAVLSGMCTMICLIPGLNMGDEFNEMVSFVRTVLPPEKQLTVSEEYMLVMLHLLHQHDVNQFIRQHAEV